MKRLLIVLVCVIVAFGASYVALSKFVANNDRSGTYNQAAAEESVQSDSEEPAIEEETADATDATEPTEDDGLVEERNDDEDEDAEAGTADSVKLFGWELTKDQLNAILMDKKASEYSSKTEYLALVNCTTHRVGIYKGSQGNWQRVKYFKCGDGKPETPTIHGDFETGPQTAASHTYKLPYFDSEGARCWYATRINGPYLFHSVLYKVDKEPLEEEDGRVGAAVSHGCIRLKLENAKWIYDTMPELTRVIIYIEDGQPIE